MSVAAGTIPPPISWAQRKDLLYVIIDVECTDIEYKVTDKTFTFKGVNVNNPSLKYEVTLNFYGEVDPEKVKTKNILYYSEFTIYKKESGPFWPQLTNDKSKLHFLKANFRKWQDESDDEIDTFDMSHLNKLDEQFKPDGKDFKYVMDFDSSDDDIPSLEPNDDDEDGAEAGADDVEAQAEAKVEESVTKQKPADKVD